MLLSDSGCRNRRTTAPPPPPQQQAFWLLVERYLKLEAQHKQLLQALELQRRGGF